VSTVPDAHVCGMHSSDELMTNTVCQQSVRIKCRL